MSRRRTFRLLALTLSMFAAGCVSKAEADGAAVYGFAWWVIAIPIGIGAVLGAVAAGAFKKGSWIKGVLLGLAGLAVAIVGAATMASDKLTIDDFGMRQTGWGHGFDLKFSEIAAVRVTQEERIGNRGRRVRDVKMHLRRKSGATESHPVGDLLKQCWNDMASAFRKHGVDLDIAGNVTELP